MLIRILNTTFGLAVNGIIKPKSPKDPPFEVDEKLGERLVREGIAEAIGDIENDVAEPERKGDESSDSEDGEDDIPEYDATTSKAVLQSIANEYGIEVSANATKPELIKALDEYFADVQPDDSEDE